MTSAIKLHYWNGRRNFGDELSVAAVEWVTGVPVVHAESDAVGKLLAIGSVLEKAGKGDIVWGSGLHPGQYDEFWMNKAVGRLIKKRRYAQLEFKVLAVRGPMARDALLFRGVECPEIYGDPGILVKFIPLSVILFVRSDIYLILTISNFLRMSGTSSMLRVAGRMSWTKSFHVKRWFPALYMESSSLKLTESQPSG